MLKAPEPPNNLNLSKPTHSLYNAIMKVRVSPIADKDAAARARGISSTMLTAAKA